MTQGELHTADPYSFTSDRPWINHEWLAEVLLYLAFAAGGSLGIVALKTGIVTGALALMLRSLNRAALRPIHQDALIGIAIVVMFWRLHTARPQVFSLLLFAFLLHSLRAADLATGDGCWKSRSSWRYGRIFTEVSRRAWGPLLVASRAGASKQGCEVQRRVNGSRAAVCWRDAPKPYGFGLWQFLWSTVGLSRNMADWRPMLAHGPIMWAPFLVAACICGFMMLRAGARLDWAYQVIVVALFLGAMRVSRLDAFFGIAMVMLVAPALNRSGKSSRFDVDVRRFRLPVSPGLSGCRDDDCADRRKLWHQIGTMHRSPWRSRIGHD